MTNTPDSHKLLLQHAIAFKAIQLLRAAQTAMYYTEESRAQYFVSQRYAGVFFDLTTRAMQADIERDNHIGEALIADYKDAHPDYSDGQELPPVIRPVNYADTILTPAGAFTRLDEDPLLRAGIDLEVHSKKALLKTLGSYTGAQLQELIKERNELAVISQRDRSYKQRTISYAIRHIEAAWNEEIEQLMERQLPHYTPFDVTQLIIGRPYNLEPLSHGQREVPSSNRPSAAASKGADANNVIRFTDRAKQKNAPDKDDDKTPGH